uniref:Uncharacterized protein n=1 Tax=Seriola dumerili TaxID=41447 RepID=A0A3B4VR50_SERDU
MKQRDRWLCISSLPMLVNVVWFFREAFRKPAYTEQLQIKTYVKGQRWGYWLWVDSSRAAWGELGDYLNLTLNAWPLGHTNTESKVLIQAKLIIDF